MEAIHIVGAGGIGCAVGYVLARAGAPVVLVESEPERLAWQGDCLAKLGKVGEARLAWQEAKRALGARPLRARQSPDGMALAARLEDKLRK